LAECRSKLSNELGAGWTFYLEMFERLVTPVSLPGIDNIK